MDVVTSNYANLHHLLLALAFATTVLVVAGTSTWLLGFATPLRRRLAEMAGQMPDAAPPAPDDNGFKLRIVEPLAKVMLPEADWQQSHLKTRLVRAGLRDPGALQLYLAAKLVLGLGLPLLAGLGLLLSGVMATHAGACALLIGAATLLGFLSPNLFLLHKIEARQQQIGESFPDGLDMLVVCVEAGLSLDGAIQRVSRELEHSHPELAEEFALVSLELRAGRSRDDVLNGLAERTGVEDIRAFISILLQTQHFGTSIAASLREQASDLRLLRMQRAREKAGKLPVKLIFPIMLFIFPAMFLVILGPAFIRIFTDIIHRSH
jgi:tight adherence protein C